MDPHYPQALYSMLFRCAWQTLDQFGWDQKYLGAQIGATMVLHTWGSNLSYHPHIHCIVPGGGIAWDNKWKDGKGNGKLVQSPIKKPEILNNGSLYLDPGAGALLLAISFNRAFNLGLAGRLNACLL